MDDDLNRKILTEVRKIRRHTQVGAIAALVVYALLFIFIAYFISTVRQERQRGARRDNFVRSLEKTDPREVVLRKEDDESSRRALQEAFDRGEINRALSIATNWVRRSTNDYYPYAWLGRVYVVAGDLANAELAYERAYELFPESANEAALAAVRRRLVGGEYGWKNVDEALDRGDTQKALSIATNWVRRRPNDYYAYAWLGRAYLDQGDLTNAEAAYSRAYELFPHEDNEKSLMAVRKRLAKEGKGAAVPK